MSKHNVVELSGRGTSGDEVTELIRDGARKLTSEAMESEVSELLWGLSGGEKERKAIRAEMFASRVDGYETFRL